MLFNGQITRTQASANTVKIMLFPNPVGKTAITSFPQSKPIIAVSCSSFETISLPSRRIFNVDKGDVTRDNLQQRFFAQHRVNFSCYVTRVNFSRNIVQNELGNMHVTRDDFSRNPTRNILRIQATRVQAM